MKKFLKTLFKSILLSLFIIMLIPMIYFTWRASQPMELDPFNGLTYYQYVEWRRVAYEESVATYQDAHPDTVIERPWSCIVAELFVDNTVDWYLASVILYAQEHPEISQTWPQRSLDMIPKHDVNWINYLPELWKAREHLVWGNAEHTLDGSVIYCRIRPNVPTREEFEKMKSEHEISATTR